MMFNNLYNKLIFTLLLLLFFYSCGNKELTKAEQRIGQAEQLLTAHPGLADKDLQLCCFIRAGFRTKKMAVLLDYTQNTVRVKRTRLVKKMGFNNTEAFLDYLVRA